MRKGVLFSSIALLAIIPAILILHYYPALVREKRSLEVEEMIFDQLNFFERNVEEDLDRILFISARRALIAVTNNIIINGTPVSDAPSSIKELMRNGTFQGEVEPLMEENNIEYWYGEIREVGELIGFNLTLYDLGLEVNLSNNSVMNFQIFTRINISDLLNIHLISRESSHGLNVSIEGLEDPTYPLNTYGLVKRIVYICDFDPRAKREANGTLSSGSAKGITVIANASEADLISDKSSKILVTHNASEVPSVNQFLGVVAETNDTFGVTIPYLVGAVGAMTSVTPGEERYLDSATKSLWDLTGIERMLSEKCYFPSGDGPDFLQRLEGNLSYSPHGIESFVDLVELSSNDVTLKPNQSVVDHEYFSEGSIYGYRVRGVDESWFRLSIESARRYGVEELLE